ncbi:MAG: RIP metalloprotease RseP [Gemmatimonadetes bacterium]|nr:MAG: RIP metalloprotease RseP [Gemmatimonadota bacterium]
MLALVAPILVFGLVIFVHELGHFVAAKLTGVYAPRFSIGFGPALFRKRRGETEYVLAALPLGGYVRMASRHDAEAALLEGGSEESSALRPGDAGYDPNAMMPFGPKPIPEHRWFESKSLGARLFIMIAGVVMNVLLAFVVFVTLNATYGDQIIPSRVIGAVRVPPGAPALGQLQPGDTITAVNAQPVRSWNDIAQRIAETSGDIVVVRTQRAEVRIPVAGAGAPSPSDIVSSLDFFIPPVIGDVLPNSPAARAGLRARDSVVAIGGQPLRRWSELQERVGASAGTSIPFQVMRDGQLVSLTLRPESTVVKDPVTKESRTIGKIGAVGADVTAREPMSLGSSLTTGARQTWMTATKIVDVVKGLLTGGVSPRQLGGPIAITRASVAAAQSGLESLFMLIALLSVNVAVLNLLPIPILDGGQILLNVAEAAKGSPFSSRTREYILRFGLVAILLIFALSTFNDVKDSLSRWLS